MPPLLAEQFFDLFEKALMNREKLESRQDVRAPFTLPIYHLRVLLFLEKNFIINNSFRRKSVYEIYNKSTGITDRFMAWRGTVFHRCRPEFVRRFAAQSFEQRLPLVRFCGIDVAFDLSDSGSLTG